MMRLANPVLKVVLTVYLKVGSDDKQTLPRQMEGIFRVRKHRGSPSGPNRPRRRRRTQQQTTFIPNHKLPFERTCKKSRRNRTKNISGAVINLN